jgi:hypothetical protein
MGKSKLNTVSTLDPKTVLRFNEAKLLDKYPELRGYPIVTLDKFKRPVAPSGENATFSVREFLRK